MEVPKGVSDLKILSDGKSRKEYECGCYHRLHERKVVWSFFPVCEKHKSAVRREWNSRPWHKKAVSYALFCWLLVLCAAGVALVGYMLWKVISSFF
jgi:hypothetical protein